MADKTEKWQEALGYWDRWSQSIDIAKKMVKDEFGYDNELLSLSIPKLIIKNPTPFTHEFRYKTDDSYEAMSDFYDIIVSDAMNFIINEISKNLSPIIFCALRDYWIDQVIPGTRKYFDLP